MANITQKKITNLYSVKVTCGSSDNFKNLWERALSEVQFTTTTQGIGFNPQTRQKLISLNQYIAGIENLMPYDIYNCLRQFPSNKFLFIFDEFDNIKNQPTRVQFADLIKSLSDNSRNIKIMIVGIAENVSNLIGNHQSLERCLMQIKMPRMSDVELTEIVEKGFADLEMEIIKSITGKIVKFSSGFPHYTHLLCKYSIQRALDRNYTKVGNSELDSAIRQAIENASEQLRESYRKAIQSSSINSQWKPVVQACAMCKTDEFDSFTTSEILKEFNRITGKNSIRENITHNLGKLCHEERGLLLEKLGNGKNIRYRFYNPMMKPYVLLNMQGKI